MGMNEIKDVADIEKVFTRNLLTDTIVRSVWQSGKHHSMTDEQTLKWIVCIFCELRNDEMQKRYDELMMKPRPFYIRAEPA